MTHHILVASEQLWPNLLGIAALRQRDGGLASLTILHTADQKRSAVPARKLEKLARVMQPRLSVTLRLVEATSQSVTGVVSGLLAEKPGEKWSINATGGTKTMFAGLSPWMSYPGVEVFYREVTGDFYKLQPELVGGLITTQCDLWSEAAGTGLDLPVLDLVRSQVASAETADWTSAPVPRLDFPAMLRAGLGNGWDWRALQRQFPKLNQGGTGFAFEDFFAALLTACGARNLATQVKSTHQGVIQHEFDVIVNAGTGLVLFDLKLTDTRDSAAANEQLARLDSDRASLGGIASLAVAVRPTWSAEPAQQDAAKARGVTLWTQEDMPELPGKLCRALGLPLTPELAALQAELVAAASAGKRLFSASRRLPAHPATAAAEEQVGWLNLQAYWSECQSLGLPLMVTEQGGKCFLQFRVDALGWSSLPDVERALAPGKIDQFWIGGKGDTGLALAWCPISSRQGEFRQKLKALVRSGI